MATADELLASQEIEVLTVDLNSRIISIPASVGVLGVESDDDVKYLRFNIPRFYTTIDLSEFKFQVNFENAKGGGDFYPIKTVEISDDDMLSFIWEVDRTAFAYSGDVIFSLCMKKYDDDGVVVKELNTTTAKLPVLKGLETTKAVVENNPSAFDTVLCRLYAVEAATGLGQDGYYSIVKVDEQNDGVVFTIMNSDGTTTAIVRHGKDGHTPVRGVDYFTDTDILDFENDLKTYVDQWSPKTETVILTASGWSNNKQTVAVSGITTDNIIVVGPDPSDSNYEAYVDGEIRCVSQTVGSLTFVCSSTPSVDVTVNVAVYYSTDAESGTHPSFTFTDDGNGNVTIA